ncbi:type II secretion system protein [Candidatus Curtissbacteria bacterium]|nr:type II secretion system protein [Candidatus Curtissbacteria bacterium]
MKSQKGFSIVELLIIMGIFAIFVGFTSLNLLNIRSKSSLGTAVDVLLTDLNSQQIKAMSGDNGGDIYGIHFLSSSYVLFKGTYSAGDPANFTVNLDNSSINTTLPSSSSELVFNKTSGAVVGFSSGANTIRFQTNDISNQKIITVNRLGVVTGVN